MLSCKYTVNKLLSLQHFLVNYYQTKSRPIQRYRNVTSLRKTSYNQRCRGFPGFNDQYFLCFNTLYAVFFKTVRRRISGLLKVVIFCLKTPCSIEVFIV